MWWAQLLNNIVALLESGAGGGGGAYESIATYTGNGSTSTVTFSSIPSTYTALEVRWIARNTDTGTTPQAVYFRFNGDTGANYTWHNLFGTGATVAAQSNTAQTYGLVYGGSSRAGMTSNIFSVGTYTIQDSNSTTKYKTARAFSGTDTNTADTNVRLYLTSNLWLSTAAINSVTFFADANLVTGTTISLYGIKGA